MSKPTRGSLRLPTLFCLFISITSLIACSGEDATSEAAPAAASANASPAPLEGSTADPHDHSASPAAATGTKSGKTKGQTAARHPNERPIPAFEGTTLAGTRLSMRDLLGARVLLFFFNPEIENAVPVSAAVNGLIPLAGDQNFSVVGVGVGSTGPQLARFAKEQALGFPVIDDSTGTITQQLRLNAPIALIGIDAEGYMTFGMAGFPADGDVQGFADKELRERLRLTEAAGGGAGALYAHPEAPALGVVSLSDGAVLETEQLRGQAAIVIFFLHTCPHCHKALESIKGILASIPDAQKPRLVAISVQNAPSAVRSSMKELGLDYFDPYLDPSGKATERWGITGGVPVVNVIDPEGKIRHRIEGWNGQRDAGMLRMKVANAAGAKVPMLLDPKGYSGNDACGSCHEQEYATWQYTQHATAFDTLITHAADRRTDCVGCHVVGFEETGGYDFMRRPGHLENVGCESCHGRGGPHLSPSFVPRDADAKPDYAQVCATCHTPTHSLGFDFATFQPRVSHKTIAALSDQERGELLEGGPSRELLPTSADYVGSAACQSCHTAEFATWQKSAHGHAVETLEKAGKAGESACLECHTTAFDRPGGFQPSLAASAQSDLASVGCESCHGPGGDHIGESARRVGTILSLGDKCDSCVILKVCGTCHDDANDPGFEFKVEQRIEDQRHGTIEAAATREGTSAFHLPSPHPPEESKIPHGFELNPHTSDSGPLAGALAPSPDADRARLQAAFDVIGHHPRPSSAASSIDSDPASRALRSASKEAS